jgi:hypothetical protein
VARYYFHIKEGAKLIYDLEGSEHPNLPAARVHALKIARDTWADAIKSAKSLSADAVVVADEHGELTEARLAGKTPEHSDIATMVQRVPAPARGNVVPMPRPNPPAVPAYDYNTQRGWRDHVPRRQYPNMIEEHKHTA